MIEQPYSGRALISDNLSEIRLTIPSRKNWFIVAFMFFWLFGWAFGLVMVSKTLFRADIAPVNLFLIVWLVLWTLGGFAVINILVWFIFGKEEITIGNGVLTIVKKATLVKPKSYDLAHISNVYAKEQPVYGNRMNGSRSLFNRGTINFEYGLKTVRFGDALDEAEARHIIEMLRAKKFIQ